MKFVSLVKNRTEQFWGGVFLGSLEPTELVYLHSFRNAERAAGASEKYRVTILVRASNIVEAETAAESRLAELVRSESQLGEREFEVRRLKPRALAPRSLKDESEVVVQLLAKLRRESVNVVSFVERILSEENQFH